LPAPPLILDPRLAGAVGAAIVCALLLLQYAHRHKPFILAWAAGWLLLAPAFLVVSPDGGNDRLSWMAVGLSQFIRVCSVVLFLWSADLFRQTRVLRASWMKALGGFAAWFVLAPLVLGTAVVIAPGFALTALLLVATASMYGAVLLERRMIGAGLIALVLVGFAVTSIASALTAPAGFGVGSTPSIFLVNVVLSILAAIGIHLLIFEEMTYELRLANRRLEQAREELLQAAITDPLTGCHNRRFLEQVQDRELKRHARFSLPLSLLFIDIDKFKAINDTLGHEAGDRVLQYVSRFLQRHIREADYVFRWGGDEFLVLITCTEDEARRKAKMLKSNFDAAPEAEDLPPGIGLSVGWVEVPPDTTDLLPLVAEADTRMYKDKGHAPAARPRTARRRS
jgi:diguanylate cyclase (GGDEF)-like protein